MSVWNRMMCAIDRVIRTHWCMPDDLDQKPHSDERQEVERALCPKRHRRPDRNPAR